MLAKLQSQSSFARGNSFRSLFPARPFFAPTTLARGLPSFHCRSKAVLLFAITAFFAATSRPADDVATLLKHDFDSAKSALDAGDLTEAERYYNRAIALGLRQVANISVTESRFDEATGEFDEALKFAPGDPEITVDAAIACFRSGDLKKARQLAQSVVGENPLHARAQDVLGRIELYRGDYPAAIRDLQTSLTLNDNFETSYFLGLLDGRATEKERRTVLRSQSELRTGTAPKTAVGKIS